MFINSLVDIIYNRCFLAGIIFSNEFANELNFTNAQYQLRFTYEQRNIRPDENVGSLVYTWSTEKDFAENLNDLNPHPNFSDGGIPSKLNFTITVAL